jgi:ATP-dependent DNA ligase
LQRASRGGPQEKRLRGDTRDGYGRPRKLGLEGIVSKRKDSPYRSGRSRDWLKMKNADAPAVKREEEEEWGKKKWR